MRRRHACGRRLGGRGRVEAEIWQCADGFLSKAWSRAAATGRVDLERHWAGIGCGGWLGRRAVWISHGEGEVRIREQLDRAGCRRAAALVKR